MANNASDKRRRRYKFDRQFGRCHWCKCPMSLEPLNPKGKANSLYATFEHLVPKADGGHCKPNNVVLAHASCNRKRGSKPDAKFERHVAGMRKTFFRAEA